MLKYNCLLKKIRYQRENTKTVYLVRNTELWFSSAINVSHFSLTEKPFCISRGVPFSSFFDLILRTIIAVQQVNQNASFILKENNL